MARTTEESVALFKLDRPSDPMDALSAAARGAVAGGPRPSLGSPLASTGYAQPGPSPLNPHAAPIEVPTVALARDDLARARERALVPSFDEPIEEEESTRAVPREELLRGQDAQVVVDEDGAGGEDATLAVSPGQNMANNAQIAAFAQTLGFDGQGAFPPPPGVFPPFGAPAPPPPAGPPSWSDAHPPAGPQAWNQGAQGAHPMGRPGSNPNVPPSGQMPISQPFPPSGHMQAPMSLGQGMHGMPPQQGQGHGQGPYGAPYGGPPQGQLPVNAAWPAPQPAPRGKISGQVILLAIVGIVCLAIFITGIVLFATTKF